jgi:pseudaminic acid cytidylyltransferase
MRLAVIPARGGSKRIPRKNIKEFCGKPMIAWSIEVAKKSGLFERIIVSTDDAEIADLAERWGAEAPFIRPAELSNDFVGTTEVISHATRWAQDQDWLPDAVCCIYATAPFIRQDDIERGLKALHSGPWDYAFSATEFASTIFRSFRQMETGGVEMLFPEHFTTRSQDLPMALHDAGQFYWGRSEAWLSGARIFEKHSIPVLIPSWRIQDIDTGEDWQRAEILAPMIFGHEF